LTEAAICTIRILFLRFPTPLPTPRWAEDFIGVDAPLQEEQLLGVQRAGGEAEVHLFVGILGIDRVLVRQRVAGEPQLITRIPCLL
jgi:hypothetical protein